MKIQDLVFNVKDFLSVEKLFETFLFGLIKKDFAF